MDKTGKHKETILITGGAGFIGSHLSEKLLKDPKVKRVVAVDNLDSAYPVKFKKKNLAILLASKKFKFYKIDIRNKVALAKVFRKEKPGYIVHLAAKTGVQPSLLKPHEYEAVNIGGTFNLLELSKDIKAKKFIFISSSSVYGNNPKKPPLKETEITDFPLSPYGATKKAGEVMSYGYFYNYNLPVTCIRLFNVYGERMRPGVVLSHWVEHILKGKSIELGTEIRRRDFTYVGDVVEAIAKSLWRANGYNIFNVANSNPASLAELLAIVEKACGKKSPINERKNNRASIKVSHADITKARKVLGWKPKTSLKQGVSRYVTWFKRNRLKNFS